MPGDRKCVAPGRGRPPPRRGLFKVGGFSQPARGGESGARAPRGTASRAVSTGVAAPQPGLGEPWVLRRAAHGAPYGLGIVRGPVTPPPRLVSLSPLEGCRSSGAPGQEGRTGRPGRGVSGGQP